MKRSASEENLTGVNGDNVNSRKNHKLEDTDEDIIMSTRTAYIITDQQLNITNLNLRVIVVNDNILCTDIILIEGDTRIFKMAKKDILKYLLKMHKKLIRGHVYVVYVNN
ncbi:hypothetical protein [Psilogramma increta granulovirus]|uniref:Uncharacterized protein n=1 Tax=Psilogramma increta granulovirus TaxID=2953508 RepID=A0A977XVY6_9BBAC|nr:hypothetical protein [Psilogramma increta granulovirus]